MWLSSDTPDYPDGYAKEKGNDKVLFRSNSPPLEGGESLCEIYGEHLEKKELKFPHASSLTNTRLNSIRENLQNAVFYSSSKDKFLLNQDLLCSDSFTQSFLQSILSSVDSTDPVIASSWMETLLDVVDLLPEEIVKGEILTLAVNKGQLSQPVSSRLLCCKMIGKICLKLDAYIIMKELLPVVLSLCQDCDFKVRGHMCRQLDVIARRINIEATKSVIIPELVELANDTEAFVRLAGIETVVQMIPIVDDDTCKLTIIPLVRKFCQNSLCSKDSTLPVVSRLLGRLCHGLASYFSPEQKEWFIGYFQELSKLGLKNLENSFQLNLMQGLPEGHYKDCYQECRHACAFNFPAIVLFSGPENFKKELYSSYKELCSDPFPNVRQTMACGFYEVARLLGSQASLLYPELVLLLHDESIEVLKCLIPCLPESLKIVCCAEETNICIKDEAEKKLVKALLCCEEASSLTCSWRLHADFLSCLSCLPFCISSEILFDTFVPLLFVKLHTSRPLPCKIAAAYSLLIFLRSTFGLERRHGIINELIRELCYGKSCHKRMLFVRVCELAIEIFSKVFFKIHFFKPLLHLSADPVPNIRLRLCSVLPHLKSLIRLPKDSVLLQELESCVKTLMTYGKDRDVASAVSKAIQELDKIEIYAESVSLRSSVTDLNLKDWQKEKEEKLEFTSKFIHKKASMMTCVLETLVNKGGKIPIRKSGTFPKLKKTSVSNAANLDEVPLNPSHLLRKGIFQDVKKEHRISNSGLTIDAATRISKITDDSNTASGLLTTKFSIPITRSQNTSMQASNIPKKSFDHCLSLKTISHSDHLANLAASKIVVETSQLTQDKGTVFVPTSKNAKVKIKTLPLSGLRKSSTFSNFNSESKIPTSSLKRRSTVKD